MGKRFDSVDDDARLPGLEKAFGLVLREHRRAKGLSQQELALESGYDRAFLSRLERGLRRPSLTTFILLARLLSVPSDEFLREVEARLEKS
jgi:transcriptional regulator with XRE-family HTH domain